MPVRSRGTESLRLPAADAVPAFWSAGCRPWTCADGPRRRSGCGAFAAGPKPV